MARRKTEGEALTPAKKPKMKPRGGNSPVIGDNGLMLDKGDNTKFLTLSMQIAGLPAIDLKDAKAVEERIVEYFRINAEQDMKPTVMGMAMALGMSRQKLWAIAHNAPVNGQGYVPDLPKEVSDSIKKGYYIMENLWEQYMQNGKINPVSGIFLGKNNYGYQDKTEYVVTPKVEQSDYDAEEIRKRYLDE